MRSIKDAHVAGKRVLVREDLNVPMKDGNVADVKRIDAALPTLRWLAEHGARTILVSHLGRPDGKPNAKYSLKPVADALSKRLAMDVTFAADVAGPAAHEAADALHDGQILLLENVRFEPGEESNDPEFAEELASLADIYVNDAFGTAHRAHASTEGVAHLLPAYAGLLMQAEIDALSKLVNDPAQPYVCVIGGAKVKDKVGVFTQLMEKVQAFCIGGGMANTFLAAKGIDVGKSLRDDDLDPAKNIIALAAQKNIPLHLPVDAVVSPGFDDDAAARAAPLPDIGEEMILDIGPKTAEAYAAVIEKAKTIVFNGPMGVYEKEAYRAGTKRIGEAMVQATHAGATTVVGGGDAAAAAEELGFADKVTHVSTGGGATLEFLEGKVLPGIKALEESA